LVIADAYQFCNYDRGHIAPLATFSKSDRFFVVNYLKTPANHS
jgi:DNA/RNA endonuclease G (NUC1)